MAAGVVAAGCTLLSGLFAISIEALWRNEGDCVEEERPQPLAAIADLLRGRAGATARVTEDLVRRATDPAHGAAAGGRRGGAGGGAAGPACQGGYIYLLKKMINRYVARGQLAFHHGGFQSSVGARDRTNWYIRSNIYQK